MRNAGVSLAILVMLGIALCIPSIYNYFVIAHAFALDGDSLFNIHFSLNHISLVHLGTTAEFGLCACMDACQY